MSVFIKRKTGGISKSYEITPEPEDEIKNEEKEISEEEQKTVQVKKKGRPRLYEPGKNPNKLEYNRKWAKEHYEEGKEDMKIRLKKYNQRCKASYHILQELRNLIENEKINLNNELVYSKIKHIFVSQNEEISLNPN